MRKREKKLRASAANSGNSTAVKSNQDGTVTDKGGINQPAAGQERRPKRAQARRRQPHMVEVVVVLFAMFGLPISYIIYRKSIDVLRYFDDNSTKPFVQDSSPSYTFKPWVYDYEKAHKERLEAMKKYEYSYDLQSIDRRKNLSLEEFHDVYDSKWPVLISNCVPEWPAFKKWDVDFFVKHYGKDPVTMSAVSGNMNSKQSLVLTMSRFLEHIDHGFPTSYTYLEDELFIPRRPELHEDIGTCNVLEEDFFRLFQSEVRPWYAFLLWGTRFSRSRLHIDPYNWTGTNAVLSGLKRWKLYPPGQDHLMWSGQSITNRFPLASPSYPSTIDAYDEQSVAQYPKIRNAKVLEFYQYPGELLIIPSGWYHQAFNEQPTLAVSGQLMNTRNYRTVLEEMFKVNNIPRSGYPTNMESMSPKEQITEIVKRLPKEILEKGRESTDFILKQLKQFEINNKAHLSKSAESKKEKSKTGKKEHKRSHGEF